MKTTAQSNRRGFLKTAALGVALPTFIPSSALGKAGNVAPSNRVTFGAIGLGGRGMGVMRGFLGQPDIQVLALCDVQSEHWRDGEWGVGKARFGTKTGKEAVELRYSQNKAGGKYKGCDVYQDYRNLCARKDIDAVMVGTPDHWHAVQCLEALRNGKDIYCEKPITHLFGEGQALYREVAKRKAIFQTGSQQRSDAKFRLAAQIVRNGLLGKVKRVEVGLPSGHNAALGNDQIAEPPANLDYESWCGPSEKLPYIFARHHRNWRWNLAYGGGQLMDWIGHHNDIAHWALDMDQSGPIEVEAKGFTYPTETEVYDAAVDYRVVSKYAGGIEVEISSKFEKGTKWIGENGWVHVTRGKIKASNNAWLAKGFDPGKVKVYTSTDHTRNFIEGVKNRKECICPAETAHRSITPGHLGLLSAKLGRKLKWDPKKETIKGDAEAAKMLNVNYRYPWKLA